MSQPEINLKSLVPDITSHKDISDLISHALFNQHEFERRLVSPYESDTWNPQKTFIINLDMIDRVYDIECCFERSYYDQYQLYCRVYFENIPYYVNLYASTDSFHGWDCKHCSIGVIYFTKSPIYFFNHVISKDFCNLTHQKILQSLNEDGFKIPLLDSLYHIPPINRRNVPSLKLLCHESIHINKNKLYNDKLYLPQIVLNSVNEYTDFKIWDVLQYNV